MIKVRSNPLGTNPYLTAQEMTQDLDNIFGEFDRMGKADSDLHDPKFGMGMKDSKESFDAFYARFSAAIAPLDFADVHKISNLRRLISKRLRYKVSDGNQPTSFRDFVRRLRQVDIKLR